MRKKFTMLLASLFLTLGTAWADNVRFDAKSTPALPGTKENNQYTWKSSEMTAPDGFTTLRLTFLENEGNGADNGGFPHVALAEFYLYDKDGQPVTLTEALLSSNATETQEGESGIHELCDGNTTKQSDEGDYDWYWHSYWSANAGAYHYLEINVADIANLSTFAVGYVSRQSDGTPTEILVTTGSSTADVAAQYNSYMLFSKYDLSTQAFRIKNSNITDEERFLTIETPNLNNRDEDGVKILPKSYGDESEAQAWKFIPQDDGTYRIQSESGYFLNNHGSWGINAEDDTQGHELDNPQFTLEYLKDGEFRIKSASGYVGPNNSYSTDHPYEMFGNHGNDKQYLDWKIEPYTKQYIITCEYVLGDKSVSTTSYCAAGETYSFSNPYGFTTVTSCTKDGAALTASNGTYSFTATEHATVTIVLEENLPFTPTTITNQGAFADNTVWYILMQKTTNNYWKYHSEGDNNVRATTSGNSIYDEKQMWCFTGNALEGFKIYNKSLGTNHSLSNGDPAKLVENNTQTWYARESNNAFAASDIRFGLARPGKTGNSEYANLQTANDVLKGWSLDAGSTTCAVSITDKYAEIAAAWEKLLTVEEGAIGSLTTTEGFQDLIDAYKANPSQETENAVKEFIAANDFELESGSYYMIVSAYDPFKNNQGVEKAIYSDNSDLKWATRDNGSKAYYWEAVTVDGQLRFKNCNDGSYMAAKATTTDGSTSTDIVMWNGEPSADAAISYNAKFEANTTDVLTQLNLRLGETGNLHANSHGSGTGNEGNIIFYGSGANGTSAWRVIKSEHPDLAAAKGALQARIDELNAIVANMGNAVGQNKEGDKDALLAHKQTAEGVMEGGSETPETYTEALTVLNNSLAALDFSVILPQAGKHYLIKSAKPEFLANQGVEMAMYSNASNGLLYWKALDEGDRTFYWTITPNNDGTSFVFQNAGDNKYIPAIANDRYTMTEDANSAQSFNLSFLGSRQFNIAGSGTMHMMGHSNGNGTTDRICGYDGGLNTPSAWYIVEVDLEWTIAKHQLELAIIDAMFFIETNSDTPGFYGSDEEGLADRIQEINGFKANITPQTPVADIQAQTALAEEIIESFKINTPQAGKFYRFKHPTEDVYMLSNVTTVDSKKRLAMGELDGNEVASIFYHDGNTLLSYAIGQHLSTAPKNDATDWTCLAVGAEAPVVTYGAGTTIGTLGFYLGSDNTRAYYSGNYNNGYVNAGGSIAANAGYDWEIEEVTTLPVTVTSAGYATLYAPVALEIPENVTVYTASVVDNYLELHALEADGIIPANTGVIIEAAQGTYNFDVTDGVAAIEGNALTGKYAKSVKNADAKVYTLQNGANGVGFYLFKGEDTNGTTYINGFRAWVELPLESEVQGLRIRFAGEEGDITSIDNSQLTIDNAPVIYDLAGRRIEKATEKGIYIVNGQKVVIK